MGDEPTGRLGCGGVPSKYGKQAPLWDIARKGDIDTTPGRRHTRRAGGGDSRVHSVVLTPSKKSVDIMAIGVYSINIPATGRGGNRPR